MRTIAVRRHSLRAPGAAHLSPAGRDLAERIGRDGPYDRAVSSPAPRAIETVRAMGCAVDRVDAALGPIDALLERELGPVSLWADGAIAIRRSRAVADAAARIAGAIERAAGELPEGGRGLVVTHAGVVELAVARLWPAAPFLAWGASSGGLEGAELRFEAGRVVAGGVLRVASD